MTFQSERQRALQLLVATALAAVLLLLAPTSMVAPAGAQEADSGRTGDCEPDLTVPAEGEADAPIRTGQVRVLKVTGLIDPIEASFIQRNLAAAAAGVAQADDVQAGEVQAIVLQMNTTGVSLDDDRLEQLLRDVETSSVPVIAWVGPSGSDVEGDSHKLVSAADVVSVAPGAGVNFPSGRLTAADAPFCSETLNALVVRDLDGEVIDGVKLDTARFVEGEGGVVRPELTADVRFGQIDLGEQLFHTVASPAVAYLFLAIGLVLLMFEFYTAGVGVAGVVGAVCILLSGYGLWVLPTSGVGLGLILFSMFGFGIDVQAGIARVWTGIGTACFVLGSFLLFDGLSIPWLTLIATIAGVMTMMLGGMPAVVRSRFSTPTIGREWMIGSLGISVQGIDKRGIVAIGDARWRAFTNRATPIGAGETVRVVGIEGVYLEVEPEEGGAKDYREMRSSDAD